MGICVGLICLLLYIAVFNCFPCYMTSLRILPNFMYLNIVIIIRNMMKRVNQVLSSREESADDGQLLCTFLMAVQFDGVNQCLLGTGVDMILVVFEHILSLLLPILMQFQIDLQQLHAFVQVLALSLQHHSSLVLELLCFEFGKFAQDVPYLHLLVLSSLPRTRNTTLTPALDYLELLSFALILYREVLDRFVCLLFALCVMMIGFTLLGQQVFYPLSKIFVALYSIGLVGLDQLLLRIQTFYLNVKGTIFSGFFNFVEKLCPLVLFNEVGGLGTKVNHFLLNGSNPRPLLKSLCIVAYGKSITLFGAAHYLIYDSLKILFIGFTLNRVLECVNMLVLKHARVEYGGAQYHNLCILFLIPINLMVGNLKPQMSFLGRVQLVRFCVFQSFQMRNLLPWLILVLKCSDFFFALKHH